jgi:hypothetical protein
MKIGAGKHSRATRQRNRMTPISNNPDSNMLFHHERRAGIRRAVGTISIDLTVCLIILVSFQGCSETYLVMRDHVQALRQDDAPLIVLLDNGARIESPAYCHVFGTSPDSLLLHLGQEEPRAFGLTGEEVLRMKREYRMPDSPMDGTCSSRAFALWCKGTRRDIDGNESLWSGAVPLPRILSVEVDDDRYLPLAKVQPNSAGTQRITLRDGTQLLVDSAHFGRDTTAVFESANGKIRRLATRQIMLVDNASATGSVIVGVVAATAAGAVLFGVLPTVLWQMAGLPSGEPTLGGIPLFVYTGMFGSVLAPMVILSPHSIRYVFPR